jgi:hypothetical protein
MKNKAKTLETMVMITCHMNRPAAHLRKINKGVQVISRKIFGGVKSLEKN